MTIKEGKEGKLETRSTNLNLQQSYNLEIKYSWLTWTDVTKHVRFGNINDALAEQERTQKLIKKDWWMQFKYRNCRVPVIFIFESQFKNISIKIIDATERIINVKGLLSA